jgi:hypothetical protein
MPPIDINRKNVSRIAERIVANELEARGFRISDLNTDGTAANADLLAVGHGQTLQIQVKGAANRPNEWWFQYGYCTDEIILNHNIYMFNRRSSFYKADYVVLVAVRSPFEYQCAVLPVTEAERAAQLSLDHDYRKPRRDGQPKKPNKVYATLRSSPREKPNQLRDQEREILMTYLGNWEVLQNRSEHLLAGARNNAKIAAIAL